MSKNLSEVQPQLKDSLNLLKTILGADLLGVYLFGSALVGGLQKYSDIDLFVVINRKTTPEEKTRLINSLLQISGIYLKDAKRPIEITLVERREINPWKYPPHFDFQYGEWLRTSFERGVVELWHSYEMPNLALIITQVLLKSQTLLGPEPEKLLARVPYQDFINAMLHDLERLKSEVKDDTRNVLLTLARIWSTLETNAIRSKPAAAEWLIKHLPQEYRCVNERARSICTGKDDEYWDDIAASIDPCIDFILEKIHETIPSTRSDGCGQSIRLID